MKNTAETDTTNDAIDEGIPQRTKCGKLQGVVPEVCPRETHSNSLQPTQTPFEANFDCLGLPTGLGLRAIPLHQFHIKPVGLLTKT